MAKRNGKTAAREVTVQPAPATFSEVAIDRIVVLEGANPRKAFDEEALAQLVASVREHGILEPLVVRRGDGDALELIAGERRLRAARAAGLETVPVIVRDCSAAEADEWRLIENLQRQDLNAIEEAEAFRALLERHGYTQEQLAQRLGISQPQVANRLRLLELPDEVRDLIARGMLSAAAGKELLRLRDYPDELVDLAKRAAEAGFSYRTVAQCVEDELRYRKWREEQHHRFEVQLQGAASAHSGDAEEGAEDAESAPMSQEERVRQEAEKERQRVEALLRKAERRAAPAPAAPELDAKLAERLRRVVAADPWAGLGTWGAWRPAYEREAFLPLRQLLEHFTQRAELGATQMPAQFGDVRVRLPEQGVVIQADPPAYLRDRNRLELKPEGAVLHLYTGTIWDPEVSDDTPVYYRAAVLGLTDATCYLWQWVAMPGTGRTIVVIDRATVQLRKELKPAWLALMNSLPAYPGPELRWPEPPKVHPLAPAGQHIDEVIEQEVRSLLTGREVAAAAS